jgi:HAD superfamily hydrolase (TIGR01509 family)
VFWLREKGRLVVTRTNRRPAAHFCPLAACTAQGLRKPAAGAYEAVTAHLQLPPQRLIFIDDRQPNVDAAVAAGMRGIKFGGSAAALEQELQQLGLEF